VEFHPKSEATTAKQRAPGGVIKVVDMSKVGGDTGSTGVFLGVVSPSYKNASDHFKANACILVDVRKDPIKMFTNSIPDKLLKDLNGLIRYLPEFSSLGIQDVEGVALFFDKPSKTRFNLVEKATYSTARRVINGVRRDQRAALELRIATVYQPVLHWYNTNAIKLYRPLKDTVTWIHNEQASPLTALSVQGLQVCIVVMHIHFVRKLLLHKICAVRVLRYSQYILYILTVYTNFQLTIFEFI
jgi:hypothetical protein